LRVPDVNDTQKAAATCLSDCDTGPISARTVFSWTVEYIFNFFFLNVMIVNVWQAGFWINVETDVHALSA
jgi:hypothetical protein